MAKEKKLLTQSESADYLDISTRTFYRWEKKGILNLVKKGSLYTLKSLKDFIK
jgi:excisionase family DNA binding protein